MHCPRSYNNSCNNLYIKNLYVYIFGASLYFTLSLGANSLASPVTFGSALTDRFKFGLILSQISGKCHRWLVLSSVRNTIRADRGPIQNVTKRMVLTYGVQIMMISLSSLSVGVRYAATKKSSWTALFLVSRLSRRYWYR